MFLNSIYTSANLLNQKQNSEIYREKAWIKKFEDSSLITV